MIDLNRSPIFYPIAMHMIDLPIRDLIFNLIVVAPTHETKLLTAPGFAGVLVAERFLVFIIVTRFYEITLHLILINPFVDGRGGYGTDHTHRKF